MRDDLPIEPVWFEIEHIDSRLSRYSEPHVNELVRANFWHLRGRDRDLVVDSGLGVGTLREFAPELFENNPVMVVTHAHPDHVGSAHEFEDVRIHPLEILGPPIRASLLRDELELLIGGTSQEMPGVMIDAVPSADFCVTNYSIPTPQWTPIVEGDRIDLGDRTLRVLHLPGHSPGSLCIFDETTGELFSGDVIYDDGPLLDDLHESSVGDYVASIRRLEALPVVKVYPGHGAAFDRQRMLQITAAYLASRGAPRKV